MCAHSISAKIHIQQWNTITSFFFYFFRFFSSMVSWLLTSVRMLFDPCVQFFLSMCSLYPPPCVSNAWAYFIFGIFVFYPLPPYPSYLLTFAIHQLIFPSHSLFSLAFSVFGLFFFFLVFRAWFSHDSCMMIFECVICFILFDIFASISGVAVKNWVPFFIHTHTFHYIHLFKHGRVYMIWDKL